MSVETKPELQRVLESRKRDQQIRQRKQEDEARRKISPLEAELLKRQKKLEEVTHTHTHTHTHTLFEDKNNKETKEVHKADYSRGDISDRDGCFMSECSCRCFVSAPFLFLSVSLRLCSWRGNSSSSGRRT